MPGSSKNIEEAPNKGPALVSRDHFTVVEDPVPGKVPRGARRSTNQSAVLVREDGTQESVLIIEISEGGFRLSVTETPRIGERVVLRMTGRRDLQAQIRWALADRAGAKFL